MNYEHVCKNSPASENAYMQKMANSNLAKDIQVYHHQVFEEDY